MMPHAQDGTRRRQTRVQRQCDTPVAHNTFVLLPLALGVLYLDSFILPHTSIYQGDSSPIFLSEAVRMLRGEWIYRSFFELTLPGTQAVYLALFRVFGIRAWVPDLMFVLVGTMLAWTVTAIARRVVSGRFALVPGLTFLAFVYTTEPDATHHWYSALAVMGALLVLIEKRSYRRLAAAGTLCGLATSFTQSRGAAAVLGIAAYLFWEHHRRRQNWRELLKAEFCLCGPFLGWTVTLAAYLVSQVGWRTFAYSTIVFPLKYYPLWFWNTPAVYLTEVPLLPEPLEMPAVGIWLFVHLLLPSIYILLFVRRARLAGGSSDEPWDKLMLLAFVGMSLFLSVSFSASWLRLCSVSLPGLIILAWFIKTSGRFASGLASAVCLATLATLAVQITIVQTKWHRRLDARVGDIDLLDPDRYEKFRWVSQQTHAGEFLFQASDCDLYYPLDLRNPAQVPFLTSSEYTRPEQVEEVIRALQKHQVRLVLWSVWLDLPLQLPFERNRLAPLRNYLLAHYHIVKTFGAPDYEDVWERNSLSARNRVHSLKAPVASHSVKRQPHQQH